MATTRRLISIACHLFIQNRQKISNYHISTILSNMYSATSTISYASILYIVLYGVVSWYNANAYQILDFINNLFDLCCCTNQPDYYPTSDFPWSENIRGHYQDIREEFLDYANKFTLPRMKTIDHFQTFMDTTEIPWNFLFLKVYNVETDKLQHFPKTKELLSHIPRHTSVMISILPAGKSLAPHCGSYKGVLRYQLALIVPKDNINCKLVVNNKPYWWKEGEDLMFDDTIVHYVVNNTDEMRVVIMLDIQRDFHNIVLDLLNTIIIYCMRFNPTIRDIIKNTNKY
jgi:ornithine lipid ester-linked acyl 2-hydroxylase